MYKNNTYGKLQTVAYAGFLQEKCLTIGCRSGGGGGRGTPTLIFVFPSKNKLRQFSTHGVGISTSLASKREKTETKGVFEPL